MKIKNCRVCGSTLLGKAFSASDQRNATVDKFTYVKCSVCDSLLLDEGALLDGEFFDKYYGDKYYADRIGLKSNFEFVYSKFINYIKKKLIKSSLADLSGYNILDVGAGNLGFLKSIRDKNAVKYGIDIYKGNRPNNSSIKLINDDFITHNFGGKKFDVITSWHVIEHVAEPVRFLQKIYSLLKNNGVVVISTPNINSFGFLSFDKNWYHLDAPRHIVLFTDKSLANASSKAGFKEIQNRNMFYEFPFDLWHSSKKSGFATKVFILLFYPILKIFDRETITFILKK